MQRNGKLPHSTTAVLELLDNSMQASENLVQASENLVQASENLVQASENLVQASENLVQAPDNSPRPNKHSLNTYRSDDAIERRFLAAHLVFETVLEIRGSLTSFPRMATL